MECSAHKGAARWLAVACVLTGLTACGTTPADIHKWGYQGRVERIRAEMRKSPSEGIREAVAIELGKSRDPTTIPDLVLLSQDPSAKVRLAATEALGRYAGREVYSAILQRTGDDNKNVVSAAERILKTWGSESIYVMEEALTDRNYRVRAHAAEVLGRMGDPGIAPALMERAKQDDHSMVRREAVKALGNLGAADAKPLLYTIKHSDPSKEVCMEAERALNRIGGHIFDGTLLVVPAIFEEDALAHHARVLESRLREGVLQAGLCDVLMAPPAAPETVEAPTDATQKAVLQGRTAGSTQVAYGHLQREGNRVTVTLTRLDVATGRLLQQESLKGFETDVSKLIGEIVEQFVKRFR